MNEANGDLTLERRRFLVWLVIGLVGLIYACGLFVPWRPAMPTAGLDPSWRYVLNVGFDRSFAFGKDLVFTFGPWGFLYAKLYYPATFPFLLTAWAALSAAFVWACWQLVRSSSVHPLVGFLWLVSMLHCAAVGPDQFFFIFCLLFALHSWRKAGRNSWVPALMFGCALALTCLVKLTFLFLSSLLIVLASLWEVLSARRMPRILPIYLLSLTGFWIAAGQSLSQLPAFLRHSMWITEGYSEAMALWSGGFGNTEIVIFTALAALLVSATAVIEWRKLRTSGLIPASGLVLYLFISMKAGFVRHDAHALTAPFTLLAGVLGYMIVVPPLCSRSIFRVWLGLCLVGAIGYGWLSINHYLKISLPKYVALSSTAAVENIGQIGALLRGDATLRDAYEEAKERIRMAMPVPLVRGSVDIYPDQQAAILAHDLSWRPRPVFQSYSAYTESLAGLNKEWLGSDDAPDFIFFDVSAIDGRFPAQEEGISWPVLLTRYKVRDANGSFLQLQRREPPDTYRLVPRTTLTASFGATIQVPPGTDAPVWVHIDIQTTWLARLLRFLFKAPELYLTVETMDRQTGKYRLIPGMARSGFLLSPLVTNRDDFALLATSSWRMALEDQMISRMKLLPQAHSAFLFQPEFKVSFFELEFPHTLDEVQEHAKSSRKSKLVNISTRGQVFGETSKIYGGFVINGGAPKRVLVRARGPGLAASGVPGALPDPFLELVDQGSGQVIASNDNWQSPPFCSRGYTCESTEQVIGTSLDPCLPVNGVVTANCQKEAVLIVTLPPGLHGYTVQVSGTGRGVLSGTALVEVSEFDASHSNSRMVNVSTRGQVNGETPKIYGGIVINGGAPKRVLVRARGPGLAASGVSDALPDPFLELVDQRSGQVIASNDNWQDPSFCGRGFTCESAGQIVGTAFDPCLPVNGVVAANCQKEAVLIVTLPATVEGYGVLLSGAGRATGGGLVEIYEF